MTYAHSVFDGSKARSHRGRVAIALMALALLAAACGSYHTEDELVAAVSGPSGDSDDSAASDGTPSTVGTGTSTVVGDSGAEDGDSVPDSSGSTDAGGAPAVSEAGAPAGVEAGSPEQAAGSEEPQCTGNEETLKIGSVGQQSGVFGPFLQPITAGVQVWVSSVNAKGGVACHPIEYIIRDDGGDPSVHQSQVQQLVEQEGVIAFVAQTAPLTGNASVSYLTRKGVPVIGNEGGSEWTYSSPVFFPQLTTGEAALGAFVDSLARVGKPQGKTKLAVVTCLEAALCSSLFGDAEALAKRSGLELVYLAQASLAQPDFTSICQNAKSEGAELFAVGLDSNSIQRVLRNCQSVGFNPISITGGPLLTPELIADPRAEGFLVSSATDLYSNTSNPSVATYQEALGQYAPGLKPSVASIGGWTAGRLLEVGLKRAPEPTRDGLLQGLASLENNDLGGLTYPLTFTAGRPPPRVTCNWIGQVKDGKLVPADGVKPGRFCE